MKTAKLKVSKRHEEDSGTCQRRKPNVLVQMDQMFSQFRVWS